MNKIKPALTLICLFIITCSTSIHANTLKVTGTIYEDVNGTYFDIWNINMLNSGSFTIDLLAYESISNTYVAPDASDINGDGELTFLDPDTYFYHNTGNPLQEADFIARCDDINNNCDTIDTPGFKLTSLSEAEGATDGSIHFRRDPAFNVSIEAGNYLYLIADYRLTPAEAVAGLNSGDSIRGDKFHADYQITFSSDTMYFSVDGDNINISATPIPAAFWLFGSCIIGLIARTKRTI